LFKYAVVEATFNSTTNIDQADLLKTGGIPTLG